MPWTDLQRDILEEFAERQALASTEAVDWAFRVRPAAQRPVDASEHPPRRRRLTDAQRARRRAWAGWRRKNSPECREQARARQVRYRARCRLDPAKRAMERARWARNGAARRARIKGTGE